MLQVTKFLLQGVLSMYTFSKALTFRSYGVGLFSSAFLSHNYSRRAGCEPLRVSTYINPLSRKDSLPLFNEIKPDHILPAVENDLSGLKKEFAGKNAYH